MGMNSEVLKMNAENINPITGSQLPLDGPAPDFTEIPDMGSAIAIQGPLLPEVR